MTKEDELIAASEAAAEEREDVRERLRYQCLRRGYNGILALNRFLRARSEKESNTINSDEVIVAIQDAGIEISEDDGQNLVGTMDPESTGAIDCDLFINAIRPELNETRKELVEKAFGILDETDDGIIALEDIKSKYDASKHPKVIEGVETEDQILERFLNRFEGHTEQDGKVTKEEFLDYYSGISEAIDDDDYFVEMMKSCWKIEE